MKGKYKIGTRIEYAVAGGTNTGNVTGYFMSAVGFFYEVDGNRDSFVPENKVVAAYKRIEPKKTTKTVRTAKTRTKTNAAHKNADQDGNQLTQ